ncbi:MAG: cell division protein FtsZ, partial [Bacteroidales bacterium]|nr:cell division protein FtsZ [Bacteroidales bacterium]
MIFDAPKEQASYIKVIGVGGGGGNAVNHMYEQGIKGVDFIVCNTDKKSLMQSPVPTKIQLGPGLGAGKNPEVAKKYAYEKAEEIQDIISENTRMLFITAGMGGG